MTIEPNGYIVTDMSNDIYGIGSTPDEAMADAERYFAENNIVLLQIGADSSAEPGNWYRWGDLDTIPATAALLQAVREQGGNIEDWSRVSGIDFRCACLDSEAT